jgi:hypothetical protein
MNQRLKDTFGTLTHREQFIVECLARLVGDEGVDEILDEILPQAPETEKIVFGKPLNFYAGLSRARLTQADIGLTDEQVDEVYRELGVEDEKAGGSDEEVTAIPASARQAFKAKDGGFGFNEGQAGDAVDLAIADFGGAEVDADGTSHALVTTVEQEVGRSEEADKLPAADAEGGAKDEAVADAGAKLESGGKSGKGGKGK